jgi:hypothetical protein
MEEIIDIRKVGKADVAGLADLYDNVWPDVSFDKLQKAKFVLEESEGVSYCAVKNGEFVGSRTSFYMPFFFGERRINCVQFADSCVRKDCRGKRLFLKMNQAFLHGFFDENNGDLVYNISVDASRAAYEKLGWNYIKSLHGRRKYMRPIKTLFKIHFDVRKLRGPLLFDGKTEIIPIDPSLLTAREEFFNKKVLLHNRYTSETMAWRLKSGNSIRIFEVAGVGVVIYKIAHKPSGVSFLSIGEVFLYDYTYQNFKKLLNHLDEAIQPDIMSATITLGHPLLPFYKRFGILMDINSAFLNHGVKVVSDEMKDICYCPENWALSMLDIDTF